MAGAIAIIAYLELGDFSALASSPAPKNIASEATAPMMTKPRNATCRVRRESPYRPCALDSDTMREIATGRPAVVIMYIQV